MSTLGKSLLCVRNITAASGCYSKKFISHSTPILKDEVLHYLNAGNDMTILDMTFGSGLHTECILKATINSKVIVLDRDPHAYAEAKCLAQKYPDRVVPLLGRFSDLPKLLTDIEIQPGSLDSIVIDVGCSNLQIAQVTRGFNPNMDGFLDMRMDGDRLPKSITAADVLSKCDEHDLHKIFQVYGREEQSKKLAKAIISCRYQFKPLQTTFELKNFINESFNGRIKAKNVFFALRAFVNNEINELNYSLIVAQKYLKRGGNLVTLTYNQLEDLIVKRHLTGLVFENHPAPMNLKYYSQNLSLSPEEIQAWKKSAWTILTKHVIPSKDIVGATQSSARLRAAVKTE